MIPYNDHNTLDTSQSQIISFWFLALQVAMCNKVLSYIWAGRLSRFTAANAPVCWSTLPLAAFKQLLLCAIHHRDIWCFLIREVFACTVSVQSYFLLSSVLMLNAFIVFYTAARTVSLWLACRNTKCSDSESWGLQVLTAPDSAAPLRVTTCYLVNYIAKTVFHID